MQFPTGGKSNDKPTSVYLNGKVSRFGVNPKPTVTVWMKENKQVLLAKLALFILLLTSFLNGEIKFLIALILVFIINFI